MDRCCRNCPVTNCTVREILQYVTTNKDNCDNGLSAVAVAMALVILFEFVISSMIVIVMFGLFYHNVYKKILQKCRRQNHQPEGRSDQESIQRGGPEGITYDVNVEISQLLLWS